MADLRWRMVPIPPPSLITNDVVMISLLLLEYMLYVSQLNNSIRHLTVEVFWVLVYLHWYMFKRKAHVDCETRVMGKARLQLSCESLPSRPRSALWKTLKIALVLQATKNFHNNWRSGLLGRRELPKKTNKQTNGLNARTILITTLVVHSTAEIMFTFINQ